MSNRFISLALDEEGALWSLEEAGRPERIGDDLSTGLERTKPQLQPRAAVLAHPYNARLIVRLLELKKGATWPQGVWLGPPSAIVKEGLFLGQCDQLLPASLGGWRRATWADEITYSLLAKLESAGPQAPQDMGDEVLRHPAWPAVSFIEGFDEGLALRLIAEIQDPRWHVDLKEPDSDELLFSRFGLDGRNGRRNMRAALADDPHCAGARYDRARLVLNAWSVGTTALQDNVVTPSFLLPQAPTMADRAAALLDASRHFLRFVKEVWLDNLTPPRIYMTKQRWLGRKTAEKLQVVTLAAATAHTRQLFVPEQWFADAETLASWQHHYRDWLARRA